MAYTAFRILNYFRNFSISNFHLIEHFLNQTFSIWNISLSQTLYFSNFLYLKTYFISEIFPICLKKIDITGSAVLFSWTENKCKVIKCHNEKYYISYFKQQ